MNKNIERRFVKLLSGAILTSVVATPLSISAMETNNSVSTSFNTRATKIGVVNTTALNVRSGAGASYAIIGCLSEGTKVEIIDTASNGWYKIKYGSGYGYVNNNYIKISSSSTNTETTTTKTGTVNTDSLNVRSGAGTSYSKIGSLSRGTKVSIVATTSNGWYKIKFNSGYGYVSGDYITFSNTNTSERKNLNNFLFIGDSFTYLLQDTIRAKNSNVYIYAESGSMPGYWLDKVSSMPQNSQVDGVILLTGVNGASYESNKTDVKALINKLSTRYPNKTIYVQKIFPVAKSFTGANPDKFNSSINTLNNVIKSHVSTVSNAKFIDTTTGFVDKDGYLIHHNGDGLHIAASYNNAFYNNIFNAVKAAEGK